MASDPRRRGSLSAFVLLLWSCWAAPAQGKDALPVLREASILSRLLVYDTKLRARAGARVVIAVVYRSGHSASETTSKDLLQAFTSAVGQRTIHQLPVAILRIPFTGADALDAHVARSGLDALYICPGLADHLAAVTTVSRKRKVLTFAARADYVAAGLGAGAFLEGRRPRLLINLSASRAEGAVFSSALLRLARIVGPR